MARLRRELGTLEAYAALVGILVGAGIFRVTSDAWALTGSSVILGYLILAPMVLATSVPYAVFLSTPLGREPGGEYTHISRTFGGNGVAFVGAWLKIISYLGALAFLANAFADYVVHLAASAASSAPAAQGAALGDDAGLAAFRLPIALGILAFFFAVHTLGVRWFGRVQVALCSVLGVSIAVLVVPGLLAIRPAHYSPVFSGGLGGFAAALPPLFFAYAGFESLAQTAGEVRDSTRRLPRVFLRGILGTTVLFALMSVVAFGVLPGARLAGSTAPMAEVASVYLPRGTAWIVTVGALMAFSTSLNATMLVPSRLALMLAQDGLVPAWIGAVSPRTGTPLVGLTLTFGLAALLLASGQISLALNIAVAALVVLYLLHSYALWVLPRRNPRLYASRSVGLSRRWQDLAALASMGSMATLLVVQAVADVRAVAASSLAERARNGGLTSLELLALWTAVGVVLYRLAPSPGSGAALGGVVGDSAGGVVGGSAGGTADPGLGVEDSPAS